MKLLVFLEAVLFAGKRLSGRLSKFMSYGWVNTEFSIESKKAYPHSDGRVPQKSL